MPYQGISVVRATRPGGGAFVGAHNIVVLDSELEANNFEENFVKKLLKMHYKLNCSYMM